MRDRDYYPAGAYNDPNAPYNEVDPEPIEVNVKVAQCLCREAVVTTKNYDLSYDEECGGYDTELHDGYADLLRYYQDQHKSIPELLDELAKYIRQELAGGVEHQRKWELEQMLEDCEGWTVDGTEIDDYETQ
jgi:hypothetical protein